LSGIEEVRPLGSAGLKGIAQEALEKNTSVKEDFLEAMKDDFNSALALGYLHDLTHLLNRVMGDKGFRKDPAAPALLQMGRDCLLECGGILGLFQWDPAEYFSVQRQRFLRVKGLKEEEMLHLIAQREAARKEKNWARADEIRTQAATMGIVLQDGPKGTTWRPAM